MLSDEKRASAPVPLEALKEKAKEEHAASFETFKFTRDGGILNHESRRVLSSFLDFMWKKTSSGFPADRVDMRLCVSDPCFTQLFDLLGDCNATAEILQGLKALFGEIKAPRQQQQQQQQQQDSIHCKIALRMTRG